MPSIIISGDAYTDWRLLQLWLFYMADLLICQFSERNLFHGLVFTPSSLVIHSQVSTVGVVWRNTARVALRLRPEATDSLWRLRSYELQEELGLRCS